MQPLILKTYAYDSYFLAKDQRLNHYLKKGLVIVFARIVKQT